MNAASKMQIGIVKRRDRKFRGKPVQAFLEMPWQPSSKVCERLGCARVRVDEMRGGELRT